MVADGRIKPEPRTRIAFRDVRKAHELLESGDNLGKIVLAHEHN